ncbi:MAG: hypothetical protein Q4D66_02615 [Bacteroidales bacterium]|nr:hypothetical protein [Bacteroidales bacterium]
MNNRFCRMGTSLFGAMLLLSASGLAYSCSDDYDLDERKPDFLGESIYEELKKGFDNGKVSFNTTIRLIDDLGYTDVMAKTGSKTLFVASDAAYEEFFKNNKWGVRSYEELNDAQKRVLFNGAQFNNAYVMEMMANVEGGEKNQCLRQNTAAAATDSVPLWKGAMLPTNYNEETILQNGRPVDKEKKFWARHAAKPQGIYMAIDATTPMMTHFLEGQMKEKSISYDDVAFILGRNEVKPGKSFVFDAEVVKQDVVCLNGYFHQLDRVLVPPSNMAEEIRLNPSTQIFSHILDRFSAPYYDGNLTANFKALYGLEKTDSVFEKRYFSIHSAKGRTVLAPDETALSATFPRLNFDPGWNALSASTTESKERNMSAMFVPNDEALKAYFLQENGRVLMERYATKKPVTEENLVYNIDQIPLDVIQALVNNLMKSSFNETVPSKYFTIMNDARDQMFTIKDYPTVESYKNAFEKAILANNGVVYVMKKVISPADYASVIAPALYSDRAQVVRTVVRADDSFIQGNSFNSAPLKQYFSTYLKAMQSRFSFFIPTDDGLKDIGYVDPATVVQLNKSRHRIYSWSPGQTGAANAVKIGVDQFGYLYDEATGLRVETGARPTDKDSRAVQVISSGNGLVKKNLLIEMLNQHIIVHENNDKVGVQGQQKYFLSRMGAPVVVKKYVKNGDNVEMEVNGGYQEQLAGTPAAHNCRVVETYDQTGGEGGYGNGMTYFLDRPMQATTKTTYAQILGMEEGVKFRELCMGVNDDLLQKAGFRDAIDASKIKDDEKKREWKRLTSKYKIFLRGDNNTTGNGDYNVPDIDSKTPNHLVRFFNNYRYTVYVPSNAAVQAEIDRGLPTWESIEAFLNEKLQEVPKLTDNKSNQAEVDRITKENEAVKTKAKAMVVTLVNFLKYHFQDESLFVDNVERTAAYMTACVDEESKVYVALDVKQTPGALNVTDKAGRTVSINTAKCNLMARDTNFDVLGNTPNYIRSSSYVVAHQIDKALVFDKKLADSYTNAWSSLSRAKSFVAKYNPKD